MLIESLFVGLVVATLYIEILGLYPGGIIVPGYIALYLDQPFKITGLMIVSLVTLLSYKMLSRFLILFGRRRFTLLIMLGGFWSLIWYKLNLPLFYQVTAEFQVIGIIIPGLIANSFERQGIMITIASMLIVSTITFFIIRLIL